MDHIIYNIIQYNNIYIYTNPPKPSAPPAFTFPGSKLRQLLIDAGAEAPNADAAKATSPTPKASGKKPKAKAKASFAEASSSVTWLS